MQTLYMDYAATTPVDPLVAEKMMQYLTPDGCFANPASRAHMLGWFAEQAVEEARQVIAKSIGCDLREIVWTSGATESNNLALKGVAEARQSQGRHIITSAIEHKAVLDTCGWLETQGFDVTYLKPDSKGVISVGQVADALRDDTILASFMWVNNELGSINPVLEIGSLLRENGVIFHVDAAQAGGKIAMDLAHMPIDLISFSAHKFYGPKGMGALYVRRDPALKVAAQMHGGGHERGMRSGTLPTHQIIGMAEAMKIAVDRLEKDHEHLTRLRLQFWQGISELDGVSVNGDLESGYPGILNVCFSGVDGESLLMALKDVAVSTGSACNSASVDPSYVLSGIGLSRNLALSSLRFSWGRFSTLDEIGQAVTSVKRAVSALRS
ncbi:IscS subfamily cysteine desulfurase [Oceanospirillum linum]|uniref:cysteine desulfurase n=1 Tax=Oceanospirillum linum TaxID=966 RepID=A0A1T1HG16_OCELI|nr:IscS subfamily cysteine desulfurase [Oceanospirillum linum]OOV88680.1 IscS subfamily cysteine desulfurase [Oceanospirillum linum]SEG03010.1 cysteine desulfurase IscS [Oleiphilus messinensis]SMP21479.1 cysteine desulfurase IscS [Oceanospirillum linum]